jgi:hypothetical protein
MAAQDLAEAISLGAAMVSDHPGFRLVVAKGSPCTATIESLETGPVMSVVVAPDGSSYSELWRLLRLKDDAPTTPWCATKLLDGAFFDPECIMWLPEYEIPLIWAMKDRWTP